MRTVRVRRAVFISEPVEYWSERSTSVVPRNNGRGLARLSEHRFSNASSIAFVLL